MSSVFNTVSFIWNHPLSRSEPFRNLDRFLAWQIRSRFRPGAHTVPFIGGTQLSVCRGDAGATGNIYVGLHEFQHMAFTLHALRPGDVFADIGANVGTYTILAAGVAGASCVSIEPAADSFEKLLFNVGLNRLQNDVRLLNVAVGAQDGEVYLTSGRGPTNHIVNERTVDRKAVVPQRTFDSLTDTERPLVTKVDIEGYELEFLKGAHRALSGNDPSALIVELSGHGTRYAASDFETATYILRFGFEVAVYDPFTRVLTPGGLATESGNVLFIRDLPFFQCRVASAEPVTVLRHRI